MALKELIAISPLIIPVLGTLILTASGKGKIRGYIATIFLFIALGTNTYFFSRTISEGDVFKTGLFLVNASGAFMSEIILFLGLLASLYSLKYMENDPDEYLYWIFFLLFICSMIGMAATFNILIMYLFLEAATVTSALLVLWGKSRRAVDATVIYIILSLVGSFIIIAGIFWQYTRIETMLLSDAAIRNLTAFEKIGLALLYLVGFGVKAGIVPFGLIWLPKAHSEAPTPISSLLSGVLVQVAAFDIARSLGCLALRDLTVSMWAVIIGVFSMIIGALCALLEALGISKLFNRDIKRVLAYSTISEIGYIVMLIGLAAPNTLSAEVVTAFGAALVHLLNHALAKALLFLSAGAIIYYSKTRDLQNLSGVFRKMPVTAIGFIIGGLSLAMVPPLFGFKTLTEILIMSGFGSSSGQSLTYVIETLLTVTLTFLWVLVCAVKLTRGEAKIGIKDPPAVMLLPMIVYIILILIFGVLFNFHLIDLEDVIEKLAESVYSAT
ncbi:MAG: complex I subunit 5 family protein [Candidatus Baldrarchaeia archaeon]